MKFLFAVLLLNYTSCRPTKTFPATMPSDFKIEYNLDGGMRDMHRNIVLQMGDCSDEVKDDDQPEVQYKWKNENPAEFGNLYLELRKINAFSLKYTNKGEVMDRGGDSFRFRINGKDYIVSDSQSDFIAPKDADKFNAAIKLVIDFTEKYRK